MEQLKPAPPKEKTEPLAEEDSNSLKKIRKGAIVKRLQNFWRQSSQPYPLTFKYIQQEGKGKQSLLFEIQDLTKKQFGVEEANGHF